MLVWVQAWPPVARHLLAEVKALCRKVAETGQPLPALAALAHPDLDLSAVFDPARQLGDATATARRFAETVRALPAPQG